MCSSDDLPVGSEEQARVSIIVERLGNILTLIKEGIKVLPDEY